MHTHPAFQAPISPKFSVFGLPLVASCEFLLSKPQSYPLPSLVHNLLISLPVPDLGHTQHLTPYQQHPPRSPGRLNTLSHKRTTWTSTLYKANHLPVLLVSVSAGVPDDPSLQPLPHGQVGYLSHDWQEEDVWRPWQKKTKQKNEIANGVRLENASWRTWWKQRNKLKTISPETLIWYAASIPVVAFFSSFTFFRFFPCSVFCIVWSVN